MVGTGVADRLRDRVSRLVYLDAFAPRDGDSAFSLAKPAARAEYERRLAEDPEGWRISPNPPPPDTDPADLPWLARQRRPQPVGAFATPLRLSAEPACPRAYIYCLRRPEADPFGPFRARAEAEGWPVFDIDASHSPNITAPALLMQTLEAALA
jgi:pimeloyl-ACP methyl ester carboxylesterase